MLLELLARLVRRHAPRTEADVQADVRQLFLTAPFELEESDVLNVLLESPLGDRRRIDVEVGSTVVEVKRDLRKGKIKTDALEQLAGYVETKTKNTGRRYVGVLTDGVDWICYHLVQGTLREVSAITVAEGKPELDKLIFWLEGVLATAKGIKPTALEIAARLGAQSSAYALDRASLADLYVAHSKLPTIQMKRTLWSRLLTSAFGTEFEDTDDLFIEHSLLVNSSEIIAHAVLGLPVEHITPASLLSGEKFSESGIYGVVESDFFDWVIEVPGGENFIRTLARRLARFDWSSVEQDVLKALYEFVISAETRKRLGEYYTPDWLAEVMVDEIVPSPLDVRLLDPACGSGTFLFHAIRKYIAAGESKNTPLAKLLDEVTTHVIGMDIHPVAVTLARVTYILAIGRERLTDPSRGNIQVPVYLGDSIQWQEQSVDLWTAGNLVIHADDHKELFASQLRFPNSLLEDAAKFDQIVDQLARKASAKKKNANPPSLSTVYKLFAIPPEMRSTIDATFKTMCRLHDEGRDHIWGYYIRNLARPAWLSRESNRVDVLIGNPPWLAYRHMTPEMQAVFRRMCEARGLWAGAEFATHQDLSALFVVRAAELYLKMGGRLAMVMPNAAVDRPQFAGFRTGDYEDRHGEVAAMLSFDGSWDLRRIRPHFFPRGASVVFGRRTEMPSKMPTKVLVWKGHLNSGTTTWEEAKTKLTRSDGLVKIVSAAMSDYEPWFTQGATFSPHFIFVVKPQQSSPLGLPSGKRAIISSRSAYEKLPWKLLSSVEGVVESEFIRPVLSGTPLLPFRLSAHQLAVVPCSSNELLDVVEEIELYPGLCQWWRKAEEIWNTHRSTERLSLFEQLDYQSKLEKQLPIPTLRVVYNASGMHLCAAILQDKRAIVSNSLYWATTATLEEAYYLCAVLNAAPTTEFVRPYMSYGKDERHFHKHVWQVPIPRYDANNEIHTRLVKLARDVEKLALSFPIQPDLHFAATRRHMREMIEQSEAGVEIGEIVYEMLS